MINKQFITISRPRFWIYTFGPFLIGVAASDILRTINDMSEFFTLGGRVLLALLFFELVSYCSYGSNVLIYGINDLADGDTDQYNDKKQGYEHALEDSSRVRTTLKRKIFLTQLLFFISISTIVLMINIFGGIPGVGINYILLIGLRAVFLFFAIFYSAKPIRAKAKPFMDGFFNVLYIIPGIMTYIAFGGSWTMINPVAVTAARLRCIAMHTFSAIPDIEPDKKAGLKTTAVFFGAKDTLLYCGGVRLWSARLASFAIPSLTFFFYPAAGVYVIMLALCLHYPVLKVYKRFPLINGIIGFLLFWAITLNGVRR